jgi:hypothetical protein
MANSRTRSRAARGLELRPVLQPLEDRAVLTTFTASNVTQLIADINQANSTGGSNTITLQANTAFTLTAVNNTTDGPTGLPVIAANDDLTIVGNGDTIERSTAKGPPAFRLFDVVAGATLTLQNLTLQGGLSTTGPDFNHPNSATGGAINNLGTLHLTGVIVQNNTAQGQTSQSALGGGIYSAGSLALDSCTIQNNQAIGGKGANYGTVKSHFGHSHYVTNGGAGFGGGLYVAGGTVSLQSSTVTGNNAQGGTKGGGGASDGPGQGGGIYINTYYNPATTVTMDTFTSNNTKNNTSSTSDPNIYGSYTIIS